MKTFIALSLALGSALTLTSCVDLAGLDSPGYGGGGYGGGGGYNSGYNNGYRPSGSGYYNQPSYNNGYRPPNYYNNDHDNHSHSNSHSSNNSNYYGGPAEWYKSGVGIGKKDRKEHRSPDYRRHSSQYDKKTESQFARGYNDGYH
jgi:hypothetical protein